MPRTPHPSRLVGVAAAVLAAFVVAVGASPAAAHTGSDVVAVPAGDEATVTLRPGHGCGDAATVAVTVRSPVRGATPGAVDGWSATAADDEDGTVLEWTGGRLPTDQTGAFPLTFTAPDTPGELLLFPAVQSCEDGSELAWISGDPTAEHPAPRLLVLPSGAAPAATVDDVPADAPGREQLVEIADVDDPAGADAGSAAGDGASGSPTGPGGDDAAVDGAADGDAGPTADGPAGGAAAGDEGAGGGAPGAAATVDGAEEAADADADDGGGVGAGAVLLVAVVVVAVVAAGAVALGLRRRAPRSP